MEEDKPSIPGQNGGTLYPQQAGKPAPPGAGRPKNPFREKIRDLAELDAPIEMQGRLVVDGVITDQVVTVMVVIPGAEAIVQKAFKQARKGNANARKWLTETGWGKSLQIGVDDADGVGAGFAIILPANGR